MQLVFLKFIEVFTRAAFVIGTSYSLSLAGTGRFGIVVTLVGLFAFAFNWERQVDIQRRYVDASAAVFDRAVRAAIAFWAFNQLLMLPVFLLACWLLADLTPVELLLAAVIVSCEHVANQTYQMALISRRYLRFIGLVAFKNVIVLLAVLPYILFAPSLLTIDYALAVWAAGQVVCVFAIFMIWRRVREHLPHDEPFTVRARIFAQHRASFTHFQIGLVAILALQFDRLAVGAILPLDQTGIYFRHVLAVSFIYQFFNVASGNRVTPTIFAMARQGCSRASGVARLGREYGLVAGVTIGGFLLALGIDSALSHAITQRYHLSPTLGAILVCGALLRVAGDFGAIVCNAWHRERSILAAQASMLLVGGMLLIGLTIAFGMVGAAIATVIAAAGYLTIVANAVRKIA